jgi:integrase
LFLMSRDNYSLALKYKKKPFEIDPLTEPKSQLLLEQAKSFMDGYYCPALLCAIPTGMRAGEMQVLKWSGIDFDNRQRSHFGDH